MRKDWTILIFSLSTFVVGTLTGCYFAVWKSSPNAVQSGPTHDVKSKSNGIYPCESTSHSSLSSSSLSLSPFQNSSLSLKRKSNAKFVFLVGIEGSGHHLYEEMLRISPAHGLLTKWNLSRRLKVIQYSLWCRTNWNFDCNEHGLWSFPCNEGRIPNVTGHFEKLVSVLKELDEDIGEKMMEDDKNSSQIEHSMLVDDMAFVVAGMVSYPHTKGKCRELMYPILDMLYDACDEANVRCEHIYIYRDLYQALRSTVVNRAFAEIHEQLKVFSTMMNVINMQLEKYPNRLASCWDYNKSEGEGLVEVGRILGWEDKEKFLRLYKNMYHSTTPMSDKEKSELIPSHLMPQMESALKVFEKLKKTCDDQYKLKRTKQVER